jgi:hypothetical protein
VQCALRPVAASYEAPRPSTDLPLSSLWLLRALSPTLAVLLVGIVLSTEQLIEYSDAAN